MSMVRFGGSVGFVFGVLAVACDGGAGGDTPGDECEVARDCQDGDLCNGAEACDGGWCVDGEAPSSCVMPSDGGCGGTCAEDERCFVDACEVVCLPPSVPEFSSVPVGTRIVVSPGVEVYVAAAGATARPQEPVGLDAGHGLLLERPGRVLVEAYWKESAGCGASFRAFYDVVERVDAAPESAAIGMDDPRLVAWAVGFVDVQWGSALDPGWMDATRALGPAAGTSDDAVSLGNGGVMTFVFEEGFGDQAGPELAVFENGFSDRFLELAFIEVSSNGVDFVRFPSLSVQTADVGPYGTLDPTEVVGVAGRFRAGFGATFDLAHLAQTPEVLTGRVELGAIRYVSVVDIVGDGSMADAFGNPVYDPTPTFGPAGFDVEAIGLIRAR